MKCECCHFSCVSIGES